VLQLKSGVKVAGMRPELVLAMIVAESAYRERGYDCIITSVMDGRHSIKSKHYAGQAFDCRTRHLPDQSAIETVAGAIRKALAPHYDVIIESDHIHVEFDPKRDD